MDPDAYNYPFIDWIGNNTPDYPFPYFSVQPRLTGPLDGDDGGAVWLLVDGDEPTIQAAEQDDGHALERLAGGFQYKMYVVWRFPSANILPLGSRNWYVNMDLRRVDAQADWVLDPDASGGGVTDLVRTHAILGDSIDASTENAWYPTYWLHPQRGVRLTPQ